MQKIIDLLKRTGYTEYESKAYIALLQNEGVTAYQISKDSGIPRARIYDVLGSLLEKGIVTKNEVEDKIYYQPLPVDVFLKKTTEDWQDDFSSLSNSLNSLKQKQKTAVAKVVEIREKDTILTYIRSIIENAQQKVIVSMWDDLYELLAEDLREISKKVPVHGITLHVENGIETVDKHRSTFFTEKPNSNSWFIVSVDSSQLIYGPSISEDMNAFYTNDPVHIRLLEDYIWHDVLVNRVVSRSENHMEDWVKEERAKFFMDDR
ncbi:transcriptional regulator [Kurthia zopfii]|uniref:Transcriptional regulator n=1 Tax=Kurthia zopfii TaxID=1650 RepID=A0A8B4QAU2_9BACL|nr:helix-turn-helix domain-containing protein [Kurthia zopfii]PWI23155.1 TrmB family transcriptional regulator [Kurthia zopfii]TDR41334.1 transcriptional regulator [Kurthia zopfii]GEK29976.1 transcriptional regulator [Kurthia zopfii]STX09839.1 Uncharacterized protein conserved in archaea [Kurthia zopfii]